MRIKICWVGKTQSAPIKTLLSDYLARVKHLAPIETIEVPDLARRRGLRGVSLVAAEGREIERALGTDNLRVVLDEKGAQLSSTEFARWLERQQMRGAREIAFIIGGPDGIDSSLLRGAGFELSLGKMTWTHEMVRVLLAEQIYRALSILRNIPYHK